MAEFRILVEDLFCSLRRHSFMKEMKLCVGVLYEQFALELQNEEFRGAVFEDVGARAVGCDRIWPDGRGA